MAGQQFEHVYDEIGNRVTSSRGGDSTGASLRESEYTVNLKNQYEQRTVPGYADITGIAPVAATVEVNGSSSGLERKGQYFRKELPVTNSLSSEYLAVSVQAISGTNASAVESGHLFVPSTTEDYTYDEDGNRSRDDKGDF